MSTWSFVHKSVERRKAENVVVDRLEEKKTASAIGLVSQDLDQKKRNKNIELYSCKNHCISCATGLRSRA